VHNPRNSKYWKTINTPAGQVRLQFATKGRKGKFWRMVWSTKTEQVTTHYCQVKGGWGIEFYLTKGPNMGPGVNCITHHTTQKKHLTLTAAVEASVVFLSSTFPGRVASADFKKEATRAQRVLEKWEEDELVGEIKEAINHKDKPLPMRRKNAPWSF
jgi:hypothetical protein